MHENNGKDTQAANWAAGIYAITLFVENREAAREFYQKIFNLEMVFEDHNSTVFRLGQTLINLLNISEADLLINPAKVAGREAGSRFVFTISVEDVDAVCAELTARGVKLLNGPMDRPWGIRTASFIDPGGYIWEIAK